MIGILNFKSANIVSVETALLRLGQKYKLVEKETDLHSITHLFLPGVGTFDSVVSELMGLGLIDELISRVEQNKIKIFCICVGFQILFEKSEEGELQGLKIFDGKLTRFRNKGRLMPNIGWEKTEIHDPNTQRTCEPIYYYYMHSFYVPELPTGTFREVYYSCFQKQKFISGLISNNIWGFQFHPERSSNEGLRLIERFIKC